MAGRVTFVQRGTWSRQDRAGSRTAGFEYRTQASSNWLKMRFPQVVHPVRTEKKVKGHVGFTATYGVDRLVWYEAYEQVDDAIGREKMLRTWRRAWKLGLIKGMNPIRRDPHCDLNR